MPELTTLAAAGPIASGDYTILMQSGVPKKLMALTSGRGTRPAKDLIVDGTTRIHVVSPVDDIGWTMRSKGIDNNYVQINPQSVAAWDYTQGDPFFIISRKSNGLCSLQTGANECTFTGHIDIVSTAGVLTVTAISAGGLATNQVINSGGLVTNRTRITGQLTGSAGGVGTYSLNFAQTVVSGAMTTGVLIFNTASLELLENGPDLLVSSSESNIWDVS